MSINGSPRETLSIKEVPLKDVSVLMDNDAAAIKDVLVAKDHQPVLDHLVNDSIDSSSKRPLFIPTDPSSATESLSSSFSSKEDVVPNPHQLVLFFDIDVTLYPASTGILSLMVKRIEAYCRHVLQLDADQAAALPHIYMRDYGLAVRGLLQRHAVDAAHYDAYVDGGLPLEQLLQPDVALQTLLVHGLTKFRKLAFTNAGIHHAERVLSMLGLSSSHPPSAVPRLAVTTPDQLGRAAVLCHAKPSANFVSPFESIVYTDYTQPGFSCKPEREAFERAALAADRPPVHRCLLIDDSRLNVTAARLYGWHAILVDETASVAFGLEPDGLPVIRTIHALPLALRHLNAILADAETPISGMQLPSG